MDLTAPDSRCPLVDAGRYGPWALVVGGSEGVGREIAVSLADAGVASVLVARSPGPLEEAAGAVRARGVECRTVGVDLTAPDAVDVIAEACDGLDLGLVVLNAGANTHHGALVDSDPAEVRRVVDLGVTAPLALLQRFGPGLRDRGRGGIVVMGSMAGYLGHEDMSVYSAVKAFSRVLVEGVWLELRDSGVDVVEVVLGVTRTPAMVRAGLDLDLPGMTVSEPADVAREVLGALDRGPVYICGGERNVRQVELVSGLDRAAIVAGAAERMRRLRRRVR